MATASMRMRTSAVPGRGTGLVTSSSSSGSLRIHARMVTGATWSCELAAGRREARLTDIRPILNHWPIPTGNIDRTGLDNYERPAAQQGSSMTRERARSKWPGLIHCVRGGHKEMTPNNSAANEELLYPRAKVAWFACIILFLGSTLAFMDRGIIGLFVVPIQRDLHLSDTQISLLLGFAFATFNALFGLPVARWIDGGRRRSIAALVIAVCSVAAASCGLAGNFWQLFLARVGLGAGEASVTPPGV